MSAKTLPTGLDLLAWMTSQHRPQIGPQGLRTWGSPRGLRGEAALNLAEQLAQQGQLERYEVSGELRWCLPGMRPPQVETPAALSSATPPVLPPPSAENLEKSDGAKGEKKPASFARKTPFSSSKPMGPRKGAGDAAKAAACEAVLAAIQGGAHDQAGLARATSLRRPVRLAALQALVTEGKVVRTGERRTTRYHLPGSAPQPPTPPVPPAPAPLDPWAGEEDDSDEDDEPAVPAPASPAAAVGPQPDEPAPGSEDDSPPLSPIQAIAQELCWWRPRAFAEVSDLARRFQDTWNEVIHNENKIKRLREEIVASEKLIEELTERGLAMEAQFEQLITDVVAGKPATGPAPPPLPRPAAPAPAPSPPSPQPAATPAGCDRPRARSP